MITPGSAAGPLVPGEPFGSRYHIIRVLGAGGMGVVYHAWDGELGVAVALKVIRPEALHDAEAAGEVQRRFNEWVQDRITATVWDRGCTSWYRTASGKNTTNWPDFTFAYRARTRRFGRPTTRRFPGRRSA